MQVEATGAAELWCGVWSEQAIKASAKRCSTLLQHVAAASCCTTFSGRCCGNCCHEPHLHSPLCAPLPSPSQPAHLQPAGIEDPLARWLPASPFCCMMCSSSSDASPPPPPLPLLLPPLLRAPLEVPCGRAPAAARRRRRRSHSRPAAAAARAADTWVHGSRDMRLHGTRCVATTCGQEVCARAQLLQQRTCPQSSGQCLHPALPHSPPATPPTTPPTIAPTGVEELSLITMGGEGGGGTTEGGDGGLAGGAGGAGAGLDTRTGTVLPRKKPSPSWP